jgi:hypothetical protein
LKIILESIYIYIYIFDIERKKKYIIDKFNVKIIYWFTSCVFCEKPLIYYKVGSIMLAKTVYSEW